LKGEDAMAGRKQHVKRFCDKNGLIRYGRKDERFNNPYFGQGKAYLDMRHKWKIISLRNLNCPIPNDKYHRVTFLCECCNKEVVKDIYVKDNDEYIHGIKINPKLRR